MVAMKKGIRLFYLIYTGYIILVCMISDLSFIKISISLMLLWLLYAVFCVGLGGKVYGQKQLPAKNSFFAVSASKKKLLVIGIFTVMCSVLSAHFYTGMWPDDVIAVYKAGLSTYQIYQQYFAASVLGVFSITKIPFIIMMATQKIIFYYSFVILSLNGIIMNKKYRIYIFLLIVSQIYFGLARGTNFEMYQLFITTIYCYISYHEAKGKKINLLTLGIFGIGMVTFFLLLLHFRGHSIFTLRQISSVISFKENNFIVTNFPILGTCVAWVFSYLGYGLFYIATMLFDVMSDNVFGVIDIFIPILYSREQTDILAVRGVQWCPDMAMLVDDYGIVITFIVVYLMGYFVRLSGAVRGGEFYHYILCFIMFMGMLSLPVGNFLSYSSEKLMLLFTIVMLFWGRRVYLSRNSYYFFRMQQRRKEIR